MGVGIHFSPQYSNLATIFDVPLCTLHHNLLSNHYASPCKGGVITQFSFEECGVFKILGFKDLVKECALVLWKPPPLFCEKSQVEGL